MRHSVLELVKESFLSEFACLEIDLVLQSRIVTEGDFFPGFLFAHTVLLFERIEGAYRKGNVRQGEGI